MSQSEPLIIIVNVTPLVCSGGKGTALGILDNILNHRYLTTMSIFTLCFLFLYFNLDHLVNKVNIHLSTKNFIKSSSINTLLILLAKVCREWQKYPNLTLMAIV